MQETQGAEIEVRGEYAVEVRARAAQARPQVWQATRYVAFENRDALIISHQVFLTSSFAASISSRRNVAVFVTSPHTFYLLLRSSDDDELLSKTGHSLVHYPLATSTLSNLSITSQDSYNTLRCALVKRSIQIAVLLHLSLALPIVMRA